MSVSDSLRALPLPSYSQWPPSQVERKKLLSQLDTRITQLEGYIGQAESRLESEAFQPHLFQQLHDDIGALQHYHSALAAIATPLVPDAKQSARLAQLERTIGALTPQLEACEALRTQPSTSTFRTPLDFTMTEQVLNSIDLDAAALNHIATRLRDHLSAKETADSRAVPLYLKTIKLQYHLAHPPKQLASRLSHFTPAHHALLHRLDAASSIPTIASAAAYTQLQQVVSKLLTFEATDPRHDEDTATVAQQNARRLQIAKGLECLRFYASRFGKRNDEIPPAMSKAAKHFTATHDDYRATISERLYGTSLAAGEIPPHAYSYDACSHSLDEAERYLKGVSSLLSDSEAITKAIDSLEAAREHLDALSNASTAKGPLFADARALEARFDAIVRRLHNHVPHGLEGAAPKFAAIRNAFTATLRHELQQRADRLCTLLESAPSPDEGPTRINALHDLLATANRMVMVPRKELYPRIANLLPHIPKQIVTFSNLTPDAMEQLDTSYRKLHLLVGSPPPQAKDAAALARDLDRIDRQLTTALAAKEPALDVLVDMDRELDIAASQLGPAYDLDSIQRIATHGSLWLRFSEAILHIMPPPDEVAEAMERLATVTTLTDEDRRFLTRLVLPQLYCSEYPAGWPTMEATVALLLSLDRAQCPPVCARFIEAFLQRSGELERPSEVQRLPATPATIANAIEALNARIAATTKPTWHDALDLAEEFRAVAGHLPKETHLLDCIRPLRAGLPRAAKELVESFASGEIPTATSPAPNAATYRALLGLIAVECCAELENPSKRLLSDATLARCLLYLEQHQSVAPADYARLISHPTLPIMPRVILSTLRHIDAWRKGGTSTAAIKEEIDAYEANRTHVPACLEEMEAFLITPLLLEATRHLDLMKSDPVDQVAHFMYARGQLAQAQAIVPNNPAYAPLIKRLEQLQEAPLFMALTPADEAIRITPVNAQGRLDDLARILGQLMVQALYSGAAAAEVFDLLARLEPLGIRHQVVMRLNTAAGDAFYQAYAPTRTDDANKLLYPSLARHPLHSGANAQPLRKV